MPYNEQLADRIRETLVERLPKNTQIEEKKMFRGVTFMVDGKMCISVSGEELMCRIDPAVTDEAMERNGTRPMVHGGRAMKGYVYVSEEDFATKKDFDYWVGLCLQFNPKAKASKKNPTK